MSRGGWGFERHHDSEGWYWVLRLGKFSVLFARWYEV